MNELLRHLSDGGFHSGADLGSRLGLSRSAIWKRLRRLRQECGIAVHAVPGKGYRLAYPLSLLDPVAFERDDEALPWPILLKQVTDSTNTEVYRRLVAGDAPPFAVLAEQQSAGKGRRGRSWVSPYGQNIYYSLVVEFSGGVRQCEGLSLTVGVAVLETLRGLGIDSAGLKWPNDVLVSGRKVAGVLVELHGDMVDACRAIIGIGINVNMRVATVEQPWTSLRNESGREFDRTEVATRLTRNLDACLCRHRRHGFAGLRARWESGHAWTGREVVLSSGTQVVRGVARGVDDSGALRLSTEGGTFLYSGGELSLRLGQ